ncbi:MAG: hypothetical protein CVV49_14490 [Spirochaetae bacterium HGW-Spirochaetae-5]|nr:MAG: hypothetical protein CVV49_14490 [Spirochaetae bacterium HGW-Spirochaetae-5]
MIKKILFLPVLAVFTILNSAPAISAEPDLTSNAVEYICTKAREGKKTRLAVYTFTDEAGDTSSETKKYSTKIMALILDKKEFKVIDPERVPEIISEQEKGLTGLVDPETAAETGKMIGADALIFGISGSGSLQVRIIDAATGEVIGATLEVHDGKMKINNDDFKSPESKKKFISHEFERSLRPIYTNNPMFYLYLTANSEEEAELDNSFPMAMKKLKQRITEKDNKKNQKFEKRRKRLAEFRNENPGFDKRIRESRANLIESLKDRKDNKRGKAGKRKNLK